MNRDNILAVAAAIEGDTIPNLGFNMNYQLSVTDPDWNRVDVGGKSCGTVGCIMGWAVSLSEGAEAAEQEFVKSWSSRDLMRVAAAWLGITMNKAHQLFYPPGGHYQGITRAKAARVLRHLAETGMVDWAEGEEA